MIAIFKPVNNSLGFDVREFEIKDNGKPGTYRWLNVREVYLGDLPVYKPKARCKDKSEYYSQFSE